MLSATRLVCFFFAAGLASAVFAATPTSFFDGDDGSANDPNGMGAPPVAGCAEAGRPAANGRTTGMTTKLPPTLMFDFMDRAGPFSAGFCIDAAGGLVGVDMRMRARASLGELASTTTAPNVNAATTFICQPLR